QEGNALGAADPLLAGNLLEMAGAAGLVERSHSHDPPVGAAAVTGRAGSGNAARLPLCHRFREVLAPMAGMIIDDPRATLEWIALEFRVMAVEAVELHHVAGVALLGGDFVQVEVDALMLLVAGRAVETACDHGFRREDEVLHPHRLRC